MMQSKGTLLAEPDLVVTRETADAIASAREQGHHWPVRQRVASALLGREVTCAMVLQFVACRGAPRRRDPACRAGVRP